MRVALSVIFVFVLFQFGCKTTNDSSTKGLKIVHKDGTLEDTSLPSLLQVEIYSGTPNLEGRIVFEGKAGEPGNFVYLDKAGKREAMHPTSLFLGKTFPFEVEFFIAEARSPIDGSVLPGEVELSARAPIGSKSGELLKHLRGYDSLAKGPKRDPLKLCFRDHSCDVSMDLRDAVPKITIDFKNNLIPASALNYVLSTDLGLDLEIGTGAFMMGAGKNMPILRAVDFKPGSPAAKSGLEPNAFLTKVDGESMLIQDLSPIKTDVPKKIDQMLDRDVIDVSFVVYPERAPNAPFKQISVKEQKAVINRGT